MSFYLKTCTAFPGVWSPNDYRTSSKLKKANPADFGNWRKTQPWSTERIFVPGRWDSRWGKIERIIYKKTFYNKDGAIVAKEDREGYLKVVSSKQKYVICLDPNSPFAGNIYNNDPVGLIYIKFVAMLLVRPIHITVTTLYCLSLLRTAKIIFDGVRKEKSAEKICQKVVRSLVDIIRTPIYGVVMIIVNLAGVLIVPFFPPLANDIRATIGRLNRELGWGKREAWFDFTPCMHSSINIMEYTLNSQTIIQNKNYEDNTNPVLVGLDNCLG